MANPVDPLGERIALAATADGGLAAFRRNLRYAAAEKSYDEWRKHPITKLFAGTVQDMLLNNARLGFTTDSLLVHHGMTLAFAFVSQLLDNPRAAVPGVFDLPDGSTEGRKEVAEDYAVSPDEALT